MKGGGRVVVCLIHVTIAIHDDVLRDDLAALDKEHWVVMLKACYQLRCACGRPQPGGMYRCRCDRRK
jgi:hypothetical protein